MSGRSPARRRPGTAPPADARRRGRRARTGAGSGGALLERPWIHGHAAEPDVVERERAEREREAHATRSEHGRIVCQDPRRLSRAFSKRETSFCRKLRLRRRLRCRASPQRRRARWPRSHHRAIARERPRNTRRALRRCGNRHRPCRWPAPALPRRRQGRDCAPACRARGSGLARRGSPRRQARPTDPPRPRSDP